MTRRAPHILTCVLFLAAFAAGTRAAAGGGADLPAARGVIKPRAEATVAVDFSARIAKLPFRDGERFKKGALLLAFDCTRQRADVSAANAASRAGALEFSNSQRLLKRGAAGANDVALLGAKAEKARGELRSAAARTAQCEILAPFQGRMVKRLAQEHEAPAPNSPLFKIVDDSVLELEVIVPSRWLVWLKPGAAFDFAIDETGETQTADVARLGAAVDPVSQTIEIYGVLKTKSDSVLPGMSGTATFRSPPGS